MTTADDAPLSHEYAETLAAVSEPDATQAMAKAGPASVRTYFAPGAMVRHYEIIRPLGAGNMGEVHLARDTRLGRLVALKFLLRVDAQTNARFVTEARATARLAHEHIVALYDIAEHEGRPYLVLEHVKGRTLWEWLEAKRGPAGRRAGLPPARAAELMLPVARALAAAHEAGVVHRDLKPQNVMLADDGGVKVVDFGIAKLLGHVERPSADATLASGEPAPAGGARALLTSPGMRMGTLAYMSPEQWNDDSVVDAAADVWAAGIMLYEMVVGEHPLEPFTAKSLVAVSNLDEPMPSVHERVPEIGKLGAVIDRCLIKHKADRLGSARELVAALEAIARPQVAAWRGHGDDANPYTGLAAFQEHDAGRFFGREIVIQQVVARLGEQPFLAVVGASGAGKSSLVRAGVIPALKRGGEAWEAFVVRPGSRPLAALAELLLKDGSRSHDGRGPLPPADDDRDATCARLRLEPGWLGVALRARARRRRERLLVFVDQFEELYTLAAEDERAAFLACLSGAADDASAPLRVIISLRHDFLDRVAGAKGASAALVEQISRGTILLGPMDRLGLESALVLPAKELDHRFESAAMIDEMLDALEHTAGALPLLQFTAARLWEGRDRERRVLTEATYRFFGGVGGALASHADSVLAAASHAERQWARALLLRLVTPERTRAIVPRSELAGLGGAAAPEVERVLGKLIDARLLTAEGTSVDEGTVELVHESLLEKWPLLARWLDEEKGDVAFRSRLSHAAKEWEASRRAEGLLWRGEAADEARRWVRRRDGDVAPLIGARERAYLDAVAALAVRSKRRRGQLVAGVIATLAVVALSITTLAYHAVQDAAEADLQAARARAQKDDAERSAARARNASRMAAARERQGDLTTALALLREIEPGSVPLGWSQLGRLALDTGVARALLRHDAELDGVAWSPDGHRVASAAGDNAVLVWNADGTGEPLVLRGHDERPHAVAWSPDGRRLASASRDKTVRVWNADGTGEPLVLRGHGEVVWSAAWSPDGRRVASASSDKTVRVWSADGSGVARVLAGHEGKVYAVAWSPDGLRIASASGDKTVRVWSADGAGAERVLRGHGDKVQAVAWSPDGRRVASASQDKTVRVWSADGSDPPLVLAGHENWVQSVAWSPDGRRIASASSDLTVRVWDAEGAAEPSILRGHDGQVHGVAWSRDGGLASASWDGTVRVWSPGGAGQALVLRGHREPVYGASVSPDGRRIASASHDKTVRVWSADGTGRPLVLAGHDGKVQSVAWSPDGQRLASASHDRTVRVWSADGAGEPLVLRGHADEVRSVAWSPDGRRLASASADKTVRVWNADGSGEPLVLRGHDGWVLGITWSPDGQRLASASEDKTVRVWNADGSGDPLVLRQVDQVQAVAWSPDGSAIATAPYDKTVRVWRADGSGDPLVLRGHEAVVGGVAWSPRGDRIASASDDATIRIWSADGTGEPLVLSNPGFAFNSVAWSPDGTWIVATSDDKTVRVFRDLEPLRGPEDGRLWKATTYCPPVAMRQRLFDLPGEQAGAELSRCQGRVGEWAR